jgi:phospholipase C
MSLCGTIIRSVQWFERQIQIGLSQVCTPEFLASCSDWQDEGYDRCDQTEDDGYNECCDWWPCSWACDALVWVSHIVCIAWSWVSKWVCRGLSWVWETICEFVISIIFYFISHILNVIFTIPCGWGDPTLDPRIRHIFVLVLENRSFDHMFGETAIRGTDAETGTVTQIQTRPRDAFNDVLDASGNITHHCVVGPGQKRSVDDDPGHDFGSTLLELCGLAEDGTSPTYPPYPPITNSGYAQSFADVVLQDSPPRDPGSIMLSYTEEDVPVITALAREFAICDNWFSSMPGPTFPNRCFFHAASSAGLDDTPITLDEDLFKFVSGLIFDNGTIYDMLDSENIDWAVYHGNFFPQVFELAGMDPVTRLSNFHGMNDFEQDLQDGSVANFVFIEPNYGDQPTHCGDSQHPLEDVTFGEGLIKRVYEAIRNSPLWGQSMLIVTYDEGGGFFDHAKPGSVVPPGDNATRPTYNQHGFDFTQLGVRVPAVVCSPWIPRNVIDHRPYEHASVPATVERLWGLPSMTARDGQAQDLSSLLTLSSPRTDALETLPLPAEPGASCPDDTVDHVGPTGVRPKNATLIDSTTLARARLHNSEAITSTPAGFLQVALRRDLLLAPRSERRQIYEQVRGFRTMGEVAVYTQAVSKEVQRFNHASSNIRNPKAGTRRATSP